MPRKSLPLGPESLGLIEDARIDLLRAALAVRDDDSEPEFELPEDMPDLEDEDAVPAFRDRLIEILSEFDPDEIRPTETRSRRIRALASGKGVTSLETIVAQKLDHERAQEFDDQPDPLCRSIWAFLNARETFEDAESFHFARQFRDHRKLYDAFEVDLETATPLDAASIDERALSIRIKEVLELRPAISCTVRALDLPKTDAHPASIMLIVRHGGPLSSVYNHRDDGRRATIYYRPPNEVTLIYTPSLRQIEVCADSPLVRQQVSDTFAEVALNHDISQKPLTWKRYNLTRFRSSLELERPAGSMRRARRPGISRPRRTRSTPSSTPISRVSRAPTSRRATASTSTASRSSAASTSAPRPSTGAASIRTPAREPGHPLNPDP